MHQSSDVDLGKLIAAAFDCKQKANLTADTVEREELLRLAAQYMRKAEELRDRIGLSGRPPDGDEGPSSSS